MNVKLESKSLTIKISEEELETLERGEVIDLCTGIEGFGMMFSVYPQPGLQGIENARIRAPKENIYQLLVTENEIDSLVMLGRSREGIKIPISGGGEIVLQVDIRKDTRQVIRV